MSLVKKLARETVLYGLSSILGRMLNAFLVPLYTNTLPRSEYGTVLQFYAWSGFLLVLYSYRMESAFFRFGTPEEDRTRTYATGMWSLLTSSILLSTIVLCFAEPIAAAVGYPEYPQYVRWFGLILAFDSLVELPFARLRLEQRPIRFVVFKTLNIVLTVALNLFWLLFCPWAAEQGYSWVYTVWSPSFGVSYIFLANLIAGAAVLLLLLPEWRPIFRTAFDPVLWRNMMRYAGPLIIVSLAGIVNEMLDRSMLPFLLTGTRTENLAQLGVYGANYKLAVLISLFTQAYRYAAEPFFFKNARSENALQTQADAAKWFTIAAAGGMAAILIFLDLAKFYIGPAYREGLFVVPVLLAANVLLGVYYNLSVWYRLKDRTGTGAWIAVFGALLTIFCLWVFVPVYGYIAAAWAHVVCYGFMCVVTWYMGRSVYPVPYPLGKMAGYIGLALLLYALSKPLPYVFGQGIVVWVVRLLLLGIYAGAVYGWEIRPGRRKKKEG